MKNEEKSIRQLFGEYLIDVSKLTFGGVVLSAVLEISHNKPLVLITGTIATIGIAVWGFLLLNKKK